MSDVNSPVQLVIHSASSGFSYPVEIPNDNASVNSLRQELTLHTTIPPEDQILLYGPPFNRLDPRKPLYTYDLVSPSTQIYLYDRRSLSSKATRPRPTKLEPENISLPTASTIASTTSSRALSESTSPLIRALADYELQFLLQYEQAKALEIGSNARIKSCEECIQQQTIQDQALNAAIMNLESFQTSISRRFKVFWKEYQVQCSKHEDLLESFEHDLEKLKSVKLHQCLATSDRQYLIDCIPVDREREWAQACHESHEHLKKKADEAASLHSNICEGVSEEITTSLVGKEKVEIDARLAHLRSQVAQANNITSTLGSNFDVVVTRIQEASESLMGSDLGNSVGMSSMFGSTTALEACRGLDEMWHEQADLLPKLLSLDDQLKSYMFEVAEKKTKISVEIFERLKHISILQSHIRDLGSLLSMLMDALQSQKEQFLELEHLRKLPDAYSACLHEVVRRRKYGREFSDSIQRMGEELAQKREEEIELREKFLRDYGQHLPRDFVPGLAEKPSHCEFRMRPFDQNLPAISASNSNLLVDRASTSVEKETEKTEDDNERGSLLLAANPNWSPSIGSEIGDHENALKNQHLREQVEALQAEVSMLRIKLKQPNTKSNMNTSSTANVQNVKQIIPKSNGQEVDEKKHDNGFPILMALAEAADLNNSNGSSGDSLTITKSTQLQEECERACLQAKDYESEIRLLKQRINKFEEIHQTQEIESKKQIDEIEELKNLFNEKDEIIRKMKTEHQQLVLNAASFEEDIQQYVQKEKRLEEKAIQLQSSLSSCQQLSLTNKRQWNQYLLHLIHQLQIVWNEMPPEDFHDESVWKNLRVEIENRIHLLLEHEQRCHELEDQLLEYQIQHSSHDDIQQTRISFRSFDVNDLALFLPTTGPGVERRVYLAFHLGCPHRYLSEESISSFRLADNRYPDYILGKIVFIDELVASERENPFSLHLGTTYFVLTVASLVET